MQQPLQFAAGYFKRFLARFDGPAAGDQAERLTRTAGELDAFLQSSFGLRAGETISVRDSHGQ
jgi:hypothetical protein